MYTVKRILTAMSATALVTLASTSVQAGPVQYSYVEGRYIADIESSLDELDDGDGFHIGGSFQFDPKFFAFGSWETWEFDDADVEADILELGAGYIRPINAQWDLNAAVSLIRVDTEVNNDSDDDTGFSLKAGTRGMVGSDIELRAMAVFQDIDERDAFVTIGADYFFQPNISAGIEMDLGAEAERFSFGARVYFN